jgi:hypothetical protein
MRLEALEQEMNAEMRTPRTAPEYLIYMPPGGAPVECPAGFDIVQAGRACARIAARHPGSTVAVYALVGIAVTPIIEPIFMPTSNEPFLIGTPTEESEP